MCWVVVPLYAQSKGLSGVEIGALFSVPIVAQIAFNLVGGAYTDRIGGRRIMLASCWLVVLGAVELVFAEGFWSLFLGQFLLVLSRAAFWPATWALATELPGGRSEQLGRINALTSIGQIAGTASAGFILALSGFSGSFFTLAATGVAAYFLGVRMPEQLRKAHDATRSVFANYAPLLRQRIIYYAILCAYLSALPFSLAMSFYPLLLKDYGFESQASGILIALRGVGSIGAGLVAARFVKTGPSSLAPVLAGVSVALAVGLLQLINHALPIGLLMFAMGLGSGVMTLYFQITMSEVSSATARGSALALGSLGWGFSHFSTPLVLGYLADHYGLVPGLYMLGAFASCVTIWIALLRPWAFAHTRISG